MSRSRLFSLAAAGTLFAISACRGVLGINSSGLEVDGGDADGGVDADTTADAFVAAPTFCDSVTPAPSFCDDFDHLPIVKYWDNSNRTPDIGASGGGTIAADTSAFRSKPQSVALSIPTLIDDSLAASGFLQKSLHDMPADMTVQFDVRISADYFPQDAGVSGSVPIVSIAYGNDFLFVVQRATGTWVVAGNTGAIMQASAPLVVGQWTTFALSIKNHPTEAGAEGRLNVRMNTLDVAVLPTPVSWQSVKEQKLVIGPITNGPMGAFAMNVDNVLIYLRSDL